MLKKLVAILIIAGAVFAFFYWFRNVEPFQTYTTPYVQQAVVFIKAQVDRVEDLARQYAASVPALLTAGAGGVIAIFRKYFQKQAENAVAVVNDQKITVESELTRVLGLNQGLQIKLAEKNARLEQLEDVEANMGKLQEQLDAKIAELKTVTDERNEAERLFALAKNPPEIEVKVE